MLNHTQELTGNRYVSSSTSTYLANSRRGSGGDREFSFWCSSNTKSSGNDCDRLEGSSGEGCAVDSHPSRETNKGTGFKSKHLPLIPSSHDHGCVSLASQSKFIAESRKELMQKVEDLPDSSFELSFQYMVEQQQQQQQHHVLQPVQNEALIDEKTKNCINEDHVRKQNQKNRKEKVKNSNNPSQILRVESMENENFLLKLFFPSSLDWTKKVKAGNVSKLSSTPSFQESVRHGGKEQRIKKSSQARDNRSNVKDNTGESTSKSPNRRKKSRDVDGNFSLGCWPFFLKKK